MPSYIPSFGRKDATSKFTPTSAREVVDREFAGIDICMRKLTLQGSQFISAKNRTNLAAVEVPALARGPRKRGYGCILRQLRCDVPVPT